MFAVKQWAKTVTEDVVSLDARRARRFAAPSAAAVAAAVVTMVVNPTLGASASAPQATAKAKTPTAKNVIFINGDGMGAATRQAARLHLAGLGVSSPWTSCPSRDS